MRCPTNLLTTAKEMNENRPPGNDGLMCPKSIGLGSTKEETDLGSVGRRNEMAASRFVPCRWLDQLIFCSQTVDEIVDGEFFAL